MMKVLHCADIHLGDLKGPMRAGKNARREDTLLCMRKIAAEAESEKPNVSIIAGDLFNRSRVWADTALEDINDAINVLIKPLCASSEQVVLLYGTQSHDNPNAFDTLRHLTVELKNLHIFTKPEVKMLETSEGMVQILAMPGVDKGHLKEIDPEADSVLDNEAASEVVNKCIRKLSEEAAKETASARILVAHYTVAGCESESGQKFMLGQDVAILPKTIDDAKVTLACMGHIHKPQKLDCVTPAYYCGSPNQLTFNDEGIRHGFYFHEIDGDEVRTRQIPTPERRHLSIHLSEEQVRTFAEDGELVGIPEEARDAIVRVYYKATSGQEKALNRAILQKKLEQDYGVFYVSAFLPEDTGDILMEGIGEEEEPREILHAYLSMKKEKDGKLTDEDIKRIEELADPILQEAEGKRATGRGTGAFRSKRIHVENYRCYKEEEFDFSDIQMAMVSGQNGAGKSSLFMDAIVDCLYEKGGRSKDAKDSKNVGEWVRSGEEKGSITFEFESGGNEYKVKRARGKKIRAELSLYRRNPETGEWTLIAGPSIDDAKNKVVNAIGMDYKTFCSTALIRQDAYGEFLKNGSTERMEVLSNILDLDVYKKAKDSVHGLASERGKRLDYINDKMTELHEAIDKEAELAENHDKLEKQCASNKKLLSAIELKSSIAKLNADLSQIAEAKENYDGLISRQGEIEAATSEMEKIQDSRKELTNMLEKYQNASQRVIDLNKQIAAFKAENDVRLEKLRNQVGDAEDKASDLKSSGCPIAETSSCKFLAKAQKASASLPDLREELRKEEEKYEETYNSLKQKLDSAQKALDSMENPRKISDDLDNRAEKVKPISDLAGDLKVAQNNLKRLESDRINKEQELSNAKRAYEESCQDLPQIPEEDEKGLSKAKHELEMEIEKLNREIGRLDNQLDEIKEMKGEQGEYHKELKAVSVLLSDYETLEEAFDLDGIPNMIIRGVVPEIETKSNEILSAMTGGKMTLEFRTERENTSKKTVNTLDILAYNLSGECYPYASHSGGEKVKIALAVTLGLADVKAQRAGVQLGMLWIDEPPFLDSDGTDAYADALASMAERNPGMKILAISHDPEMKAQFPQNITVIAGEDGSMVVRE